MKHGLDMAFSMVSPMIFGLFFGLYLDRVFQTKPWFMLGLTLLGVATGFWSLIKQAYGLGPYADAARQQSELTGAKSDPPPTSRDHSHHVR